MKNVALIMAAGNSRRCGFDKLVAQLGQKTVLEATLKTFQAVKSVDEIWIVGETKVDLDLEKLNGFVKGGPSRFQSVKNGLNHCLNYYKDHKDTRIIVHNAANPHLSRADLENGLDLAESKENLIFGFFTPNAIKQVSKEGIVNNFLDRDQVFETQTPQISTLENFSKALAKFKDRSHQSDPSLETGLDFTPEPKDEAELLALLEQPLYVYECDPRNTKITYASDFKMESGLKIGLGEDSHRFADQFDTTKPLRLGGVDVSAGQISSDGNSDGDLIIHSLCNALLSAAGEKTFDPIAAPLCAAGETKSVAYLEATLNFLAQKGHCDQISQVLISLEGAQPKVAPHHEAIVNNLATLLAIKPHQIGLTYTTGEGLNDFGKGLGMRSYCLVTLQND